ncbi:MAG: type II toxin-antitoxin system RelE/ParE family toxin [Acidobacteriia bacterium]|nr:type II toxin-antitoxin system RelE/ParE family toxin [Terriglobia bacterium]
MAHRVVWSSRAVADVEAIATYIALDSAAYARAVVKRIVNATRNLSRFPKVGREVPEFHDPKVREVFAYSYRIIYEVGDREVVIAAVIHGKRDLG